ncbi:MULTISPECIES: hypothetical protein [unclassified Sphingopyxis]|uniref:hypothetical protein n=1 Tax=unclassified Sphingopyxis TaxID=2614943 RepID=UPI0007373A03|nr:MULTISPECIES: hypothetical protein [unclassified Sphingopyxis]KTE29510.1 hypothetical protein ATE62_20985 [Sphingopyxis sp. HIX]KTE79291.1 hypothetical protein ATE72_19140 [Sphingopyxis sp. HXXIV]
MPWRIRIARAVALFLLLPAGLVCTGFPFYRLTLPNGWGIVDDTRAAFGAGTDGGKLEAATVDCTRERSGSNSSRGIGMTEYACVIDLAEAQPAAPAPAPAQPGGEGGDPYAGLGYEEAMAKWKADTAEQLRREAAELDATIARSRARSDVSNRIERRLATDRSGDLPAVRILSAKGEPRRVGLVWGRGELAWRWTSWLVSSLLIFAFGGFCLYAVRVAWRRR